MNNISIEIKDILHQGIEDITSEVKAQASWITKLEDCRRYEDEYTTNLGILRAEFRRVRGSTDKFAKLQADALKGLREDTKQVTSEMELVWHFLRNLRTSVESLTSSFKVKTEWPEPLEPPSEGPFW